MTYPSCSSDEAILSQVMRHCAPGAGWTIDVPRGIEYPYIVARQAGGSVPSQGWKLHLSADELTAVTVLERALPVLAFARVSFKVLGSLAWLRLLNEGSAGLSQVGKFLTVYPAADDSAVRLAHALDAECQGLAAPGIPSDRPVRPLSIVHYRYGAFSSRLAQTPPGLVVPTVRKPDGSLTEDVRGTTYLQPDWVTCPFPGSGAEPGEPPMRTIGNYALLRTVGRSARCVISLALDTERLRLCVIKALNEVTGRGIAGQSVRARLRAESALLAGLAQERGFPRVYEFSDSEAGCFLVLEDVGGASMSTRISDCHADGKQVPLATVVGWTSQVAGLLDVLHRGHLVHGDLKPANILVSDADQVTLIDFESCLESGAAPSQRMGTRGYRSPASRQNLPASPADDLHGLGMLLACLLTGIEPSLLPVEEDAARHLTQAIPASVPAEFAELIGECTGSARDTGLTAAEVSRRLGRIPLQGGGAADPGAAPGGLSHQQRAKVCAAARRGAQGLRRAAIQPAGGAGLAWLSRHLRGKGQVLRGIDTGVAGTILSLAQVAEASGAPGSDGVLRSAARYLSSAPMYAGEMHPGLYVGEGGVAVALLRAGQVLRDESLMARAVAHSHRLPGVPHSSPDLFNGSAGRARCHLLFWTQTRATADLEYAAQAGEALLAAARPDRDGVFWVAPPGYGGLTGQALLGYAHGAAGIGDSLLDLYEATGDRRFLACARQAMNWLLRYKREIFDDRAGAAWPTSPDGRNAPAYWCQGAVGIGRFFLHAARLGEGTYSHDVAAACAVSAARCGAWQGPTLCHGLAGAIEFLVDAGQVLGRDEHLAAAFELSEHLGRFAVRTDEGDLVWCSESPVTVTPDYMVGYAGVIACLARLGRAPQKQACGLYLP